MIHSDARAAVTILTPVSFRIVVENEDVNTVRGITPASRTWTLRVFWTPEDEKGSFVRSLKAAERMVRERLEENQRSGGAHE